MKKMTAYRLAAVALATTALASCAPTDEASPEIMHTEDYSPQGWTAKSLPEIAAALQSGEVTSEALVEAYLERIARVDKAGPTLQSVIAVNPDALAEARALDAMRAEGGTKGPLHGVPVVLKDNIESSDNMATTAGALALKDNVTGRDAPLTAGLRDAGAIILGKANLSQWANFRSDFSMSGWSALGGQVRNPHMLDRNPCGSSSGSGAAAAASLAAGTVGTETNGSVICPSQVNGIVGFKPTVGLVSQELIVPISSSQDTAGPMTKTVRGAAMLLTAMSTGEAKTDYAAALDDNALSGVRVGVLRYAQGSSPDIVALFEESLAALEAAGATLVDIDEGPPWPSRLWGDSFNVLKYEFKATLNDYLENAAPAVTTRSLEEVIAFNEANGEIELALFGQDILIDSQAMSGLDDPAYAEARDNIQTAARENGIDALLAEHEVGILVAPSGPIASRIDAINGDVWPDWPGAGSMAAIAGYPHLTVPMGTVDAMPVGLSFIGAADTDAAVLAYGYAYEQASGKRAEPQYLATAEDRPEVAKAMAPHDGR